MSPNHSEPTDQGSTPRSRSDSNTDNAGPTDSADRFSYLDPYHHAQHDIAAHDRHHSPLKSADGSTSAGQLGHGPDMSSGVNPHTDAESSNAGRSTWRKMWSSSGKKDEKPYGTQYTSPAPPSGHPQNNVFALIDGQNFNTNLPTPSERAEHASTSGTEDGKTGCFGGVGGVKALFDSAKSVAGCVKSTVECSNAICDAKDNCTCCC
jgi:hypothetical protein